MEQCDHQYMAHLKDVFVKYLGNDVVLFTNNACKDRAFECGTLQGMLSTIDDGGGKICIKRILKQSIFSFRSDTAGSYLTPSGPFGSFYHPISPAQSVETG